MLLVKSHNHLYRASRPRCRQDGSHLLVLACMTRAGSDQYFSAGAVKRLLEILITDVNQAMSPEPTKEKCRTLI